MKKISLLSIFMVLMLIGTACSTSDTSGSGENGSGNNGIQQRTLTLAHIHGSASPVYESLEQFEKIVENKSNGNIQINIYGQATLGGETEMLELLKTGVLDMAKVNAGKLESFSKQFSVFSLPYIFQNTEHFQNVMHSETVDQMYADLESVGLRGITHYRAGKRSFYTVDTPIKKPSDLEGLKIRVMNNSTSIRTMELLGASPTPMAASNVYSALQQGVIDGAESSHIALTDANHGEVAKAFSYDEHTRIPDFLTMSAQTWNSLTDQEKQLIQDAADQSSDAHSKRWEQLMAVSKKTAKQEMNVTFYEDINKEPFREKVQPLIDKRRENEKIADILDEFESLREESSS
ncbi:TRAP transporter substrate-binding protein [Salibacterium halotolerans]|uniref:Tripartite ATP-independent transporter solute receptor, DctP family n=1 Tax=Salibacterium halotolerans TaxID=1884432 RepID=A0A1I5X0S0_9BACI|nr:TRAP transporter substrate-binding protein [Salibacterium halotolerans]SFQ25500.1 tripartite ATP-independent transporter solute receptor, DctP family [Salibacterium halotolerans]